MTPKNMITFKRNGGNMRHSEVSEGGTARREEEEEEKEEEAE